MLKVFYAFWDNIKELINNRLFAFDRRVDKSVKGVLSFRIGDDEGELPFVATGTAFIDVGQADEDLIPALMEVERCDGACRQVLVFKFLCGMVLMDGRTGLFPKGAGISLSLSHIFEPRLSHCPAMGITSSPERLYV